MEREYEEKKKMEEDKKKLEVENFMREMMTASNGDDKNKPRKEEELFQENKETIEDGIPFACHICRGPFKDPIVTSCQHYFCQDCMSNRVKEVGTGCPICGKDTHGVLNYPQKLVAKKRRLIGRDGTWEEFMDKMS